MIKKTLVVFLIFASVVCAENVSPVDKDSKKTEVPTPNEPTTVAPEPKPKPSDELSFELTDKDSKICALFKFIGSIEINKVNSTEINTTYLTNDTILDVKNSFCDANKTVLSLFINGKKTENVKFELMSLGSSYKFNSIKINMNDSDLKILTESDMKVFEVDSDKSFLCKSDQVIVFNEYKNFNTRMIVKDLQVDAFKTENSKDFRQAIVCQADYTGNDFVPLAVGCALISLVFIVLIAYIIGRKRSHRMTYQSV